LKTVRFTSRFYDEEGGGIAAEAVAAEDDAGQSIVKIEKSDKAFQRQVSKAKVGAIRNFHEPGISEPPIPGGLLFTPQKLAFEAWTDGSGLGKLQDPDEKFLIIDGQHRLAAPEFFRADVSGRREGHRGAVCDFRRAHGGFCDGDVRDHQLDADADQQAPPRRSV
jgi:hypothetical protein